MPHQSGWTRADLVTVVFGCDQFKSGRPDGNHHPLIMAKAKVSECLHGCK